MWKCFVLTLILELIYIYIYIVFGFKVDNFINQNSVKIEILIIYYNLGPKTIFQIQLLHVNLIALHFTYGETNPFFKRGVPITLTPHRIALPTNLNKWGKCPPKIPKHEITSKRGLIKFHVFGIYL